jgi:hypothetical protein
LLTDKKKVREREEDKSLLLHFPMQKATHKKDEKMTTTTKTQPGTAACLKTRYQEKLMKPK